MGLIHLPVIAFTYRIARSLDYSVNNLFLCAFATSLSFKEPELNTAFMSLWLLGKQGVLEHSGSNFIKFKELFKTRLCSHTQSDNLICLFY